VIAEISQEQVEELKSAYPSVLAATEGGVTYFLIPQMPMPDGTIPESVDVLLCPTADRHGYPSRLFFSQQVKGKKPLNWNTNGVRILERNWCAYSWKINGSGLRLFQLLALHLKALQ
jgi:hypothetical protein